MKQACVFCSLDKSYPPDHSFVRGMLAAAYPRATGSRMLLLISRGSSTRQVQRYGQAVCLSVLRERRGVGRILNLFILIYVQWKLLQRYRGRKIQLFVRNDPVYLLAAVCLRPFVRRLVFQSSFPHEDSHPRWTHRWFATQVYRVLIPRTDATLVVSPTAVERIRRYSRDRPAHVVPLLDDGIMRRESPSLAALEADEHVDKLRICYLGSHAENRQLETVLAGCLLASRAGIPVVVVTVGATASERDNLLRIPVVEQCIAAGILVMHPRMPREQLGSFLAAANLGISLIPPHPHYREASPTKLAEYFAAGIPVLASYGIPLQEEWILRSRAGWLARFDERDIGRAQQEIWAERSGWPRLRQAAMSFAARELSYSAYTSVLREALEPEEFSSTADKFGTTRRHREAA